MARRPIPFLRAVADAYRSRYTDMSRFCFVFPNKRSGTFFLKYLSRGVSERIVSPEILTITDFVSRIGNTVVDNRLSSLFTLYKCYCELLPEKSRPDFDNFRVWGETVLSDFNEVGMNCSDPDALFSNLRDHREISTDFLTEEQRRIMEEYFGVLSYKEAEKSFWKHFNNDSRSEEESVEEESVEGGKIHLRKRFLKLWEILSPLYESFNSTLKEKGLTTSSGSYREARRILQEEGRKVLPWDKVVMVGFNALTHVELDIFRELKSFGAMETGSHPEDLFADFIWDATGPVFRRLEENDKTLRNSAARFVIANRRSFPEPEWARRELERAETDSLPDTIRSIASPSNVLQSKIVASEVAKLSRDLKRKEVRNARVAVVLPDENLLTPFLYALPEDVTDVNLTMGYSMKQTSPVTFIAQLRRLLRSSRDKAGEPEFYYKDLELFLSHPVAKQIGGPGETEALLGDIRTMRRIMVSRDLVLSFVPSFSELMKVPEKKGNPQKVIGYLESVLNLALSSLKDVQSGILKQELDSRYFEDYLEGLRPMRKVLAENPIDMKRDTVLALVQRMVSQRRVQLEGEPLKGLQVMGLLETRSLDFDTVIIPSLNERILPMKSRGRTFIPNALRYAYGLPPDNYSENIFAYYFYRLLSRANEVIMVHDARSASGLRTGGVSRYLHQLTYLFAPGKVKEEEYTFELTDMIPEIEPIEKTPEIKEKLRGYLIEEGRKPEEGNLPVLSATAINDYCKCGKLFFFKYVVRIPEERTPTVYIDPVQLGNIVHRVMENIYKPSKSGGATLIDENFIDSWLEDDGYRIGLLVVRAILEEFKSTRPTGLTADQEIIREAVSRMVRAILVNDRSIVPFSVLACEKSGTTELHSAKGKRVRFRYAIDRADKVGDHLRIVDYKTGSIHASGSGFEAMFGEEATGMSNFQQLMAYAGIARKIWPLESRDGVAMVLYKITAMASGKGKEEERVVKPKFVNTDPETEKKVVETFETDELVVCRKESEKSPRFREEYERILGETMDSIFDDPSFEPTDNPSVCSYCSFAPYCLR